MSMVLTTVWLTDATDPTDSISLSYVQQNDPLPNLKGEVREYGGGRFRSVSSSATQRTNPVASAAVDPTTVAWLKAKNGVPLWFRDDSGEKYHGVYYNPQIKRHSYDANSDVSFVFSETSATEAV